MSKENRIKERIEKLEKKRDSFVENGWLISAKKVQNSIDSLKTHLEK